VKLDEKSLSSISKLTDSFNDLPQASFLIDDEQVECCGELSLTSLAAQIHLSRQLRRSRH
jgi:hypothetical protein